MSCGLGRDGGELYSEVDDVDKVVEISFIQPKKSFLSPRAIFI